MNLVERAKAIVLSPQSEWAVIDQESTSIEDLYRGYVAPLAAIGPLAGCIGVSLVGVSVPLVGTYRMPVLWAFSQALTSFVLSLFAVYLISLIIDALAPRFGGVKNPLQAFKVAAYAYTPAWLAGVLHLVPLLGIVAVLASLYGLYLLYLGLPLLMKTPIEQAGAYTAVVVICAFLVMLVVASIAGTVGGMALAPGHIGLALSG